MNYVKHLNQWFALLQSNQDLRPTHIALYFVLFQLWNNNRFASVFVINRNEMMNLSKIGSKTTYSKCMNDLQKWGWINYKPSQSRYGISQVSLTLWEQLPIGENNMPKNSGNLVWESPTSDPSTNKNGTTYKTSCGTSNGPVAGHNIINSKQEMTNNKCLNPPQNLKNKYYEQL